MLFLLQAPAVVVPATPRAMTAAEAVGLAEELHRRVEADQAGRAKLTLWFEKYGITGEKIDPTASPELRRKIFDERDAIITAFTDGDDRNTDWMEGIVSRHGWPTISLIGEEGAHNAWLLVQHAGKDRGPDLPFMRRCLDLMSKLPKSEIIPRDLAYLDDRVLEQEGKKQIYGTQIHPDGGRWVPNPIEDERDVDRRRAEVGLEPLADKLKALNADMGVK